MIHYIRDWLSTLPLTYIYKEQYNKGLNRQPILTSHTI